MKKGCFFVMLDMAGRYPGFRSYMEMLNKSMDAYNQDGGLPTNGRGR